MFVIKNYIVDDDSRSNSGEQEKEPKKQGKSTKLQEVMERRRLKKAKDKKE
jgi:hypothetical protein